MEEDRQVPFAEHQERTIIGACLVDEQALNDAIEFVEVDDFYLDSHRKVFRVILDISETGNPVDLSLVAEELTRRKELKAIGGVPYLASLSEGLPRKLNVESYCRIVKQKSVLRGLLSVCQIGTTRAYDDAENPQAILEDLEQHILELSEGQQSKGFESILDSVKKAGGIEAYISKTFDPQALTGLSMGFTDVDRMTGGMQPKELTILAARPSMGKTAGALCVAINVVLEDWERVVAFFSAEMSKELLYKRMLATVAEVNVQRSMEGFLSREEERKLASAVTRIADRKLMIDDTASISVTQMRAKARRLKQKEGRLDLIVVDYLQLLTGSKKYNNREQEVSSISRGLKALAKELGVPVLALAQVGRGAEQRSGANKRPMLSDLRESGSIEADSDVVIFIHRAEYYAAPDDEDVERGVAEWIVSKNRNGATGVRKLAYNANITKFMNLEVHHD
jgi:replicative DNA helicase